MSFELDEHPHRRLNLLSGKWVLCSPHRAKRPWQGQTEKRIEGNLPEYDPSCYLCPNNSRALETKNPDYQNTFVFQNDFSALLTDSPDGEINENDLLVAKSSRGCCRVICFSPNHSLTIAEMGVEQILKIIDEWIFQYTDLTKKYIYAQLFENKGAVMGCSNPHPHGQVWAGDSIPEEVEAEVNSFNTWKQKKSTCLLCDYVKLELEKGVRIVAQNESFVALIPFWAYWPFEILLFPKQHFHLLSELNQKQKDDLAEILRIVTIKYDNLFETSFPYSMGIHQAPIQEGKDFSSFHFHFHFYPPLLRSSSVKKFLVGYEMLADLCRDVPAEKSAQTLRDLSEVHYKSQISKN